MLAWLAHNKFFRAWFGEFTTEELKKFLRLGTIFSLVIGVYWTLRPLKDTFFLAAVPDKTYIGWAKIVSVFTLLPLVIIFNKLVERFPREQTFYILGSVYALGAVLFGYLWLQPVAATGTTSILPWVWYVFVESYGSLIVALFWGFASDITKPESAKRGFYLTTMIGQLGSIVGPLLLIPFATVTLGNTAAALFICAGLILLMVVGVKYFMSVTPRDQLSGFHGSNEDKLAKQEREEEPGFFEGVTLILKHNYLLGIFAIVSIYEIIGTMIDFNFKIRAAEAHVSASAMSLYFGEYAVWVNVVSFLCLLLGVSNIQRYLGLTISLMLMPCIIAGLFGVFWLYPQVEVLFWLMVSVKGINYALNGPSYKQLYVPTTREVQYKSIAWIETFGSRTSKASASVINLMQQTFQNYFGLARGTSLYLNVITVVAFGFSGIWLLIARFLGKTHKKAIEQNKVVC
jgi:ATP:ADP antiporter, AAA family